MPASPGQTLLRLTKCISSCVFLSCVTFSYVFLRSAAGGLAPIRYSARRCDDPFTTLLLQLEGKRAYQGVAMGSGLKLAVLGDFRVFRDGEAMALPPSKKTRALFAYLAVIQRPQRRERLCEMFWEIPDDPRGALRWSLSRIRQIVGTGYRSCIRADRNTVSMDPNGFDCDFRTLASLKLEHIDELDTASIEAIADSFRGGFLEDLYLPKCPEFEAWRVAHAEQAEVLRLRLLRLLINRMRDEPERALRHDTHFLPSPAWLQRSSVSPREPATLPQQLSEAAQRRPGGRAFPPPGSSHS